MKTTSTLAARENGAFTLLEVLVVIAIIALLAGLLFPQITRIYQDTYNLKTRALITDVVNGIGSYRADYGRYPVEAAAAVGEDVLLVTDGSTPLIDTLMGMPAEDSSANLNERGTRFAEFRLAKNDRDGVTLTKPKSLRDFWGHPLHIWLDTDGDGQVSNPDAQSNDPQISHPRGQPAADKLPLEVLVFSTGKDGIAFTQDDVVSWR